MDADLEGEEEIHPSKRRRVAELVRVPVPPEVEPPNRDVDVNEIVQSGPNPVVATIFWQQRADGDDVHDLSVRDRITATVQKFPPRILIQTFSSGVWSPILN